MPADWTLHEQWAPYTSLSFHERKRDRYKANKHLARDIASINITESGNSVPGLSFKKSKSEKTPGGLFIPQHNLPGLLQLLAAWPLTWEATWGETPCDLILGIW